MLGYFNSLHITAMIESANIASKQKSKDEYEHKSSPAWLDESCTEADLKELKAN